MRKSILVSLLLISLNGYSQIIHLWGSMPELILTKKFKNDYGASVRFRNRDFIKNNHVDYNWSDLTFSGSKKINKAKIGIAYMHRFNIFSRFLQSVAVKNKQFTTIAIVDQTVNKQHSWTYRYRLRLINEQNYGTSKFTNKASLEGLVVQHNRNSVFEYRVANYLGYPISPIIDFSIGIELRSFDAFTPEVNNMLLFSPLVKVNLP